LAKLSLGAATAAVNGRIVAGEPELTIDGAAIDSRRVRGGEVFFAFRGQHVDGHEFVADALARGAAAAVVERPVPAPAHGGILQVENSLRALHDLAASVRTRLPAQLAAVTGSAGKTTTKELLAAMLARRFSVARSPGNLNNAYGLPLSLLNVPEGSQWMVAEMGMSGAGELHELSLLGRPDVAVFTVVRPVHLEFFADLHAIAEAKAELLDGLALDGLIVANAGDPEVMRIALRGAHGRRMVTYGVAPVDAEVEAVNPRPLGGHEVGSTFWLVAGGREVEVRLPLHGLYNIENCVAAAAASWALGVPLEECAAGAAAVQPAAMRGVVHRTRTGLTVVDDSYNSNPDSLRRALESAAALPADRHVAVLGEMLELGPQAPGFHRDSGELAARLGFAPLAGVGELARALVDGARDAGANAVWHPDAHAAAEWASAEVRAGDLVLVKGSRRVGLEAVVHDLLREAA
jgi:UDP-N-acetylmuramoyl-tripeptide--D-alanyl-D-alanine ligase